MFAVTIINHGNALSSLLYNAAMHASAAIVKAVGKNDEGVFHVMEVPRIMPDNTINLQNETAYTFPRATIIEALLDARDIGIEIPKTLILQECEKIVDSKRKDTCGG